MAVIINGTSGITNVNGSASTPAETGTDTDTGIYYGTNTVGLATNGTNALFIDSSQNVGIGQTSQVWDEKLGVRLATSGSGTVGLGVYSASTTYASSMIRVQAETGGSGWKMYEGRANGGSQLFWVDGSGGAYFAGNVGIGTSSPAAKLHVNTTSAALFIGYGANFDNYIQTNNLTLFTNYNGSVEYMRINSSGNVGIGLSPSYRLSVLDSAAGARVVDIQNTASTGNPIMQYSTMTVTGTTSNYFFVGRANASDRIYIYGSGNIVNVNNSYGALSDVKLKENITDATPKLSDLMRVKVRNYNLIGETQKQIGVVAQELEQVFPSMVDETIDRDTEGNELETTTKSVKYSVFVPMLIKAIQEQQTLITALTARIEALEAK